MNYTYKQFKHDFSSDDACIDFIFDRRFGKDFKCPKCSKRNFYRVKNRKCYACSCGYQLHPLTGTIFHKSATKLSDWFFAIYLMSTSKNGVSSKELQRHLGTTYKTAWRIGSKIRKLMKQYFKMLDGTIEMDETYIGGKNKNKHIGKNKLRGRGVVSKVPVVGMISRKGQVRTEIVECADTGTLLNLIKDNIKLGSEIMTDDFRAYSKINRIGYTHKLINHSKEKYVKGDIYTNTIEGFWSQIKRSIDGTYHAVSPKHLQSYIDEFSYRYNHRFSSVSLFELLLTQLCQKHGVITRKTAPCSSVLVSS